MHARSRLSSSTSRRSELLLARSWPTSLIVGSCRLTPLVPATAAPPRGVRLMLPPPAAASARRRRYRYKTAAPGSRGPPVQIPRSTTDTSTAGHAAASELLHSRRLHRAAAARPPVTACSVTVAHAGRRHLAATRPTADAQQQGRPLQEAGKEWGHGQGDGDGVDR
eukprot:360716-Chlamydomonas_euryale.AAC.4